MTNPHKADERRSLYAELREDGYDMYRAAREVGVGDSTARHYEQYYRLTHNTEPKPKPTRQRGQAAIDRLDVDRL